MPRPRAQQQPLPEPAVEPVQEPNVIHVIQEDNVDPEGPVVDPEIPEHLQGFPTKLSNTEKHSCFICGRFMSSKQSLARHLSAEKKIPVHFNDKELIEQIDLYIKLLNQKEALIPDNIECQFCQRKYHNKYYRRRHERDCNFNPANKQKPVINFYKQ